MPSPPRLRPVRAADLDALYEICHRTGAAGQDASDLVADRRLLGELYVAPYAVLEPERAFVVDDGAGGPVGYIVGALDTRAFEDRCERAWFPAARQRHPGPTGTGVLDDLYVALLHTPLHAPDEVVVDHPSHLHIDLLPPFQSGGWGRRLMDAFLDAVAAAGSRGVHLSVSAANERALGFYRHLGFVELAADDVTHTLGLRL